MAWIVDPNFGSSHTAVDPAAPFPVGGGNKVLQFGAGVIYENSQSAIDASIEVELVHRFEVASSYKSQGMGFRNAAGDMYLCGFASFGNKWRLHITRYTQFTDTFFVLLASKVSLTVIDTIFNVNFRKDLTTFTIFIDGIPLAAAVDGSLLSGPFNPCIVGAIGVDSTSNNWQINQIDNLRFNSL